MKISVNDLELFSLTETQKNVIKNDIEESIFEEDMKRRLQYILMHKYEQCFKRLKEEWVPKLKSLGHASIPLDDEELAQVIFSHPEYKNKSQKHKE